MSQNILEICLPVMLHREEEIKAFLSAKERIEGFGDSWDVPMEVGVFLYYFSKALSEENRHAQVINQKNTDSLLCIRKHLSRKQIL